MHLLTSIFIHFRVSFYEESKSYYLKKKCLLNIAIELLQVMPLQGSNRLVWCSSCTRVNKNTQQLLNKSLCTEIKTIFSATK